MKRLSSTFGLEQELAATGPEDPNAGVEPVSYGVKTTPSTGKVPRRELEAAYRNVGVIRHSLRTYENIINAKPSFFKGPNADFFTKFFRAIGRRGGEHTWSVIKRTMFLYQFIYGDYYVELIHTDGDIDRPIVDLDFINPAEMDYARDNNGQVLLDQSGNPLGYVQTPSSSSFTSRTVVKSPDQPPKNARVGDHQIYFSRERIVHIMLDAVGSGLNSISLIEPIYKPSLYLLTLEHISANKAGSDGFPIKVGLVGDMNHEPGKRAVEAMKGSLMAATSTGVIATAYYNKIQMLQPKKPEVFIQFIQYWTDSIITGIGLPKSFATGLGENTNRATLKRQEEMLKLTLKNYIHHTVEAFEMNVLRRIAASHNLPEFPNLVWPEISLDEMDSFSQRMANYGKIPGFGLSPEEADYIKMKEGFPVREKDSNDGPPPAEKPAE